MKNRLKAKRWICLAMVLVLMGLVGCSSAPPAKEEIKPSQQNIEATKSYLAYTDATYGFTMKYPSNWEKREKESGTVVGFISPDVENLNVVVEDLSKNPVKLDEYVKAALPQIQKEIPEFKQLENTRISMGSMPAQKLVYTGSAEGLTLKFMQVITIVNKKAYVFTYTGLAEEFDKHLASAQNMIDSFTI